MRGKELKNRIAKIKSAENSKKSFPRNHGSKIKPYTAPIDMKIG